jgi:hypothetical protein
MRRALVFLMLAALDITSLDAQDVTGAVLGRVLSTNGQPLSGAIITATIAKLPSIRSTLSDAHGSFHLAALPAGAYTILVRQIGYRPIEFQDVVVQLGRTTTLAIVTLEESAIDLPEIVVLGDRPLIDPTTTTSGGNLSSDAFQALPVDRNFRSLVSLFPSANASFLGDETNIGGATGQENAYYIDGINVTDPLKARTSTSLPYNFVREIQVKTGGYEAEFGRALSGIVNVVTETGGNEFRGNIFGFYTGSGLAGAARRGLLEADLAASSGYDVGVSFSGPLRRDRLWFFASYDLDRLSQNVRLGTFRPQSDERTAHLFAAKLTWRPDTRTDLGLTILGDPTKHAAVGPADFAAVFGTPQTLANPDPLLNRTEEGGVTVAAEARRLLGQRALLEASVSHLSRAQHTIGATDRARDEPITIDVATATWSGGFGVTNDYHSERTAAEVTGVLFAGPHSWKVGVELEDNRLNILQQATEPGIITDSANLNYQALYLTLTGKVSNRVASVFLQDSWSLTDSLRLNIGLRWDGEYVTGADGRRAQSLTNQFSPRIGLISRLPTTSPQTLSISFARFYEQLPTWFATTWIPIRNGFRYYAQNPIGNPEPYDSLNLSTPIPPGVQGLRGQYLDEWTVGYERLIGLQVRFGIRGVHRQLGEVIDAASPDPAVGITYVGNPGRDNLAFLPRLTREYNALEISLERRVRRGMNFLASYVLSSSWGNYTGLFASDVGLDFPNNNPNPDFQQQVPNSTGFLPNDRRHVLKFAGSWIAGHGITVGSVLTWASGTPLSELGALQYYPAQHVFLRPRGTVGRTPALFDLNLRLTYEPTEIKVSRPTIILDLFHVLSARRPVTFDQIHFLNADAAGHQFTPNPNYLKPTRYQPPMSARLGLELRF